MGAGSLRALRLLSSKGVGVVGLGRVLDLSFNATLRRRLISTDQDGQAGEHDVFD